MKTTTTTKNLTLLAVLGLGLFGVSANAQFSDNFEGSSLNPFWATELHSGSVVCPSSTRAHSGSHSVELNTTNTGLDKNVRIYHSFGAPTYGTVSFWVYDTGADVSSANSITFYVSRASSPVATIYTADYDLGPGQNGSTYNYNATNLPPGGASSGIDRTKAWHQFTLSCLPNALTMRIDSTVVYSGPGGQTFDRVDMDLGGPYWRPAWSVQFDDFQFVPDKGFTVIPYTNDAYTVLLDHFDGSTSANVLGYTNTGGGCGPTMPVATPNYSFGSGPSGLNQALTLYPPSGAPAGSGSYLKYPGGELLSQPNGTMECWVYLTSYGFGFHQYNYINECQGDLGGIFVDPTGQLWSSTWFTVNDHFELYSGTNRIPLNTWTHVALSWGSAGAHLYMNGALVATNSNTGSFTSWFGLDNVFVMLGSGCYIDELRISNIQRTHFNLPLPNPTLTIRVSQVEICWNSVTNLLYQVQYRSDLTTNQWANLGPSFPGTGHDCVTDAVSAEKRFYRVILLP